MPIAKGKIVLMGSGELTGTMVEVHKKLISGLSAPQQAVFLDTPAGFQLNVDQISETAVRYFQSRVKRELRVASFKSAEHASPYEAESAFHTLRSAQYILIGPGSPTYAVRQLSQSPVPAIFGHLVEKGGCLVAASAAALTIGTFTLPVYEIYKVGGAIQWVDGLGILGKFGFDLCVIPHWNNAEGGTHDTRRCFVGESRFQVLESQLPENVVILGLDEHTACIIDLKTEQVTVKGIGRVIVKKKERMRVFTKGDVFPVAVLKEGGLGVSFTSVAEPSQPPAAEDPSDRSAFWPKVHALERDFQEGMAERDAGKATNALLELDRAIWRGKQELESDETISEAREMLRDQIVALGAALSESPESQTECLAPLVIALLELRERFRNEKRFAEADALRKSLQQARIIVEDAPEGARWRLESA